MIGSMILTMIIAYGLQWYVNLPVDRWLLLAWQALALLLVIRFSAISRNQAKQRPDLEQPYRMLIENAMDVVFFITPSGNINWVSPAVCELLGYKPEVMQGHDWKEYVDPDDQGKLIDALAGNSKHGSSRFEARFRKQTGQIWWFSITLNSLRNSRGEIVGHVGCWHDINSEMQLRMALAESELKYRLLSENSTDVVIRLRECNIVWISPSVTPLLCWLPEECIGQHVNEFIHADDRPDCQYQYMAIQERGRLTSRLRIKAKNNRCHWGEVHVKPYQDEFGRVDGLIASLYIVDAEVSAMEKLEHRARTDELTGLLNRSELLRQLKYIQLSVRRSGMHTAVLFCDIDNFKVINTNFGHAVGDQLLCAVAERIEACLRSSDLASRVGGDELLILLQGVQAMGSAVAIAEKIRKVIATPIHTQAGFISITISVGATLCRQEESIDGTIARADSAMFEAKRLGRNRVVHIL